MERAEARKNFDMGTRMQLAEGDLDHLNLEIDGVQSQLRKLTWSLVGAVISTGTAAILLALNLIAGG